MRFFCAMFLTAALGLELKAQIPLADAIEAVVHDSVITTLQTSLVAEDLRQQYASQPDLLEKKIQQATHDLLEQSVERQLILHEFESGIQAGIYQLPESIIDEVVEERIRDNFGDRVTFIKTLQAKGMTFEQYRKTVREDFIVQQMLYKNISSAILISPHKVEVYYEQNKDKFREKEKVKLRLIILNKPADDAGQTSKLAEEILTKIKEGATFAEMASVYSQGSQRNQGGERDWEEVSGLKKELADAVATLKPGETSGVIETPEACYLLRVEDKRPAHIQPLSEVRDSIEKDLLNAEHDRLQQQWIERLKKKTFIRYF